MNQIKLTFLPILKKAVQVEAEEIRPLFWSFGYFFCLLCSYYIIRPMRDEMGILGGVENLQWLFSGTLLVMTAAIPLFGWLSSRFSRRQFIPIIYCFFIAMLLAFYMLTGSQDTPVYLARTFFIWASVFNLFVVSVFWSFMADLYSNAQARRLFGFIAAGGTVGALTGPALTALLVEPMGTRNLLLISALFLVFAVICVLRLATLPNQQSNTNLTDKQASTKHIQDTPISGGIWAGITLIFRSPYLLGICLLMLFFTTLATFLYLMQAQIIRDAFIDSEQRTAIFATIDLAVNALTLIFQLLLTSRLIKWFGLATVLAVVPVLLAAGFMLLSISPVLTIFLVVQVIRRAGNYAVMRPAREMLYVVLSREQKYKAKNVIDTVIYRAGDAISAWVYTGLRSIGLGISGIALLAVPLALIWAWIAYNLGRQQLKIAEQKSN